MSANGHKILIVEDNHDLQFIYKMKFEIVGYSVKLAENGIEGLELAKSFEPILILLDLRMPKMSGDEMLAKMRSTDWGKDIKVIILTNISKSEAPQSLRFMNVERYIVKAHYTPAQVVNIVEDILKIPAQN